MNGSRLLLDTHAFIWMTLEPEALSRLARAEIVRPQATKYVSIVSLWEIAIKTGLGKMHFDVPMQQLLDEFDRVGALHRLPIESAHLLRYTVLPMHHKDPFDRMLVAQALADDLTLVSGDESLDRYGVTRVW